MSEVPLLIQQSHCGPVALQFRNSETPVSGLGVRVGGSHLGRPASSAGIAIGGVGENLHRISGYHILQKKNIIYYK